MQGNKDLLRARLAEIDINNESRESQLDLLCMVLGTFGIGAIEEVAITSTEGSSYAVAISDNLGFDYSGYVDKLGGVSSFAQAKDGVTILVVLPTDIASADRLAP